MLLQTLPFFGNNWCNNCPLIARFMKGVYCHRRPTPRYLFTWDVSCVLNFLSSLYSLEDLSLKLLTFKVTALIALAAAPRAQTLVYMNLDNMLTKRCEVTFTFPELLKTSKVGQAYTLKIEHFRDETLYIKVTQGVRR